MRALVLWHHSLKTRVTLATLAIFVFGTWTLWFYVSRILSEDMQRAWGWQQVQTLELIPPYGIHRGRCG
jgi:hypothetical protein